MPLFLLYPPSEIQYTEQSPSARHYLIYLIPGNPGLIDYYGPFLTTLRGLLDASQAEKNVLFHLAGKNLIGFDDADHEPFAADKPPYDLDAQIQDSLATISAMRIGSGPRKGDPFDDIVVIGHSVGSYIAVEIFHHHMRHPNLAPHLNFKSGVLLFATLTHLAHSPRGRRLQMILSAPLIGEIPHRIAKGLLFLCPHVVQNWIIRNILGFPPHAAATTMRFLASRDGIWQALHLSRDELLRISEDVWPEELWEMVNEDDVGGSAPRFFIFFGQNDGWVANDFRDKFIARRRQGSLPGSASSKPRIVLDEGNLPHDFCISEWYKSRLATSLVAVTNKHFQTIARQSPRGSSRGLTRRYNSISAMPAASQRSPYVTAAWHHSAL